MFCFVLFFSRGPRSKSVSSTFLASRGCPCSLVHRPLPPSSKPVTLYLSDHSFVVISPDYSQDSSSIFKDSHD